MRWKAQNSKCFLLSNLTTWTKKPLKDTLNTKANNPVTESAVEWFSFRTLWCSCSAWWQGNLLPGFGVLRVCCTQAYRVICLPWAVAWKIHRLLLFRKMTEYLPYNPWIRTSTCSSCMALPSCLVRGVLCLQITEKKNTRVGSLFWQRSNGRCTQAHAQVFDTNEVHWADKRIPATSMPMSLFYLATFLYPGLRLWRSIGTELCLIQQLRMGHGAASNYFSFCFMLAFVFVRLRCDIKIAIGNLWPLPTET